MLGLLCVDVLGRWFVDVSSCFCDSLRGEWN